MMPVLCVLPARLGSRRIPRKPLQILAGRPLLQWSWEAAVRNPAFDEVWVATDSEEISGVVAAFGGRALLTDPAHRSGTDRVAEAAARPEAQSFDTVVNFQADEPFVDVDTVAAAVDMVRGDSAEVATIAAPITSTAEWRSASVVKVARARNGRALYFSRAGIPFPRSGEPRLDRTGDTYLRHIGIYAFGRAALERWVTLPPSRLEEIEKLEQLRALEANMHITVLVGPPTERGIDEPADVKRAERLLGAGLNTDGR
jgi:3-deoxy-manno-octulosonate cytidylyltransferase (CMP-KDO synthetase)